jgi:type 1 fimbria pilin
MKKVFLITVLSLCITSAFAAETAVLKVTGTLTNSACTPELSNGGVVDYGMIRLGELSATTVNQLGHKDIGLTINCTAATKVSWNMVDDRATTRASIPIEDRNFAGDDGISSDSQMYGVGLTGGGVKIGNYSMFVKVDSVTADGQSVDPIYMQTGSGATTWVKSTNGSTQGENWRDFTVAATGTTDPLAFQTATFPLTTSLAIQSTDKLAITDDTKLDGQLTISLNYL